MRKPLSLFIITALLLALAACGTPAAIPNPPLVLGEKYLTDLDYEQALLQFDQAILIEPKNPRGYLGKADALLHLDRQSDAAAALADGAKRCRPQRAALDEARAEVAKSLVEGYIGLSAAYERLGWREIALLLLKRVCEELPEESRLREALERLIGASENATTVATASQGGKEKWEEAYAEILGNYKKVIASGDSNALREFGLDTLSTSSSEGELGYGFLDIDHNGVAELLLLSRFSYSERLTIEAIITKTGDRVDWLYAAIYRSSCSIDIAGKIIMSWQEGGYAWREIHRITDAGLVAEQSISKMHEEGDRWRCTLTNEDSGEEKLISEEEFDRLDNSAFSSSREEDRVDFYPILKYEPEVEPANTSVQAPQANKLLGKWWTGVDPHTDPAAALPGAKFARLEFTHDNRIHFSAGAMGSDDLTICDGTYRTGGDRIYIDIIYVQEPNEDNDYTRTEKDLSGTLSYNVQGNKLILQWIEGARLKSSYLFSGNPQCTLHLYS